MIYVMIGIVLVALFGGIAINILKVFIFIPIGFMFLLYVFVFLAVVITFFKLHKLWEQLKKKYK